MIAKTSYDIAEEKQNAVHHSPRRTQRNSC